MLSDLAPLTSLPPLLQILSTPSSGRFICLCLLKSDNIYFLQTTCDDKKYALPREVGCCATLIKDNAQSKYPQGHSRPQCRFRKWEGPRVFFSPPRFCDSRAKAPWLGQEHDSTIQSLKHLRFINVDTHPYVRFKF